LLKRERNPVKRFSLVLLILAALVAAVGWTHRARLGAWWPPAGIPPDGPGPPPPRPDAERYATLKEEVERWRRDLSAKHAKARGPGEKDQVLAECRRFLEAVLPEMMRCWLGTKWDFNGTSEVPGEGSIACGYFVSTVLRDAGFRVDRYKLARQPSQNILRSFLPREALVLKVGVPYDSYASHLEAAERGIRIIGLDQHVAFLVTGPDGFRFIHSSGSEPWCVVEEGRADADVLRRSNYRVEGSLTADKNLLRRWLAGERIAVKEFSTAVRR
jgi:hypothetical protein